MSIALSTFNFIWMLFVATLIEITLNENHIQQVLGAQGPQSTVILLQPGQLLPMLIGTFSFTRCLFIAFELYRHPDGDISPSLGRADSKREHDAKADAKRASNVFKMFSAANEVSEEEHGLVERAAKEASDKATDPYLNFHQRLTPFQKVMVTWLPWLSLLFFWPWTDDRGIPISQHDDHLPSMLSNEYRRTRYSQYDTEMTSFDDANKRASQVSLDEDSALQPQRMV